MWIFDPIIEPGNYFTHYLLEPWFGTNVSPDIWLGLWFGSNLNKDNWFDLWFGSKSHLHSCTYRWAFSWGPSRALYWGGLPRCWSSLWWWSPRTRSKPISLVHSMSSGCFPGDGFNKKLKNTEVMFLSSVVCHSLLWLQGVSESENFILQGLLCGGADNQLVERNLGLVLYFACFTFVLGQQYQTVILSFHLPLLNLYKTPSSWEALNLLVIT